MTDLHYIFKVRSTWFGKLFMQSNMTSLKIQDGGQPQYWISKKQQNLWTVWLISTTFSWWNQLDMGNFLYSQIWPHYKLKMAARRHIVFLRNIKTFEPFDWFASYFNGEIILIWESFYTVKYDFTKNSRWRPATILNFK